MVVSNTTRGPTVVAAFALRARSLCDLPVLPSTTMLLSYVCRRLRIIGPSTPSYRPGQQNMLMAPTCSPRHVSPTIVASSLQHLQLSVCPSLTHPLDQRHQTKVSLQHPLPLAAAASATSLTLVSHPSSKKPPQLRQQQLRVPHIRTPSLLQLHWMTGHH